MLVASRRYCNSAREREREREAFVVGKGILYLWLCDISGKADKTVVERGSVGGDREFHKEENSASGPADSANSLSLSLVPNPFLAVLRVLDLAPCLLAHLWWMPTDGHKAQRNIPALGFILPLRSP